MKLLLDKIDRYSSGMFAGKEIRITFRDNPDMDDVRLFVSDIFIHTNQPNPEGKEGDIVLRKGRKTFFINIDPGQKERITVTLDITNLMEEK